MKLSTLINDSLMLIVDSLMAAIPRSRPELNRFKTCRVIAHRGAVVDSRGEYLENTLKAFDRAIQNGAWGIEFDIRWTEDEVPVIHHDPDCRRVFASDLVISKTKFKELREQLPEIPTFEEVLSQFSGRTHLLIEIKRTEEGMTSARVARLRQLLSNLAPVRDYHLMSLDRKSLLALDFVPRAALIAIATWNVKEMTEFSLAENTGVFTGQYVLTSDEVIRKQKAAGHLVGTGFVSSRSVLYRELNRGVDWIFTNHVTRVTRMIRENL